MIFAYVPFWAEVAVSLNFDDFKCAIASIDTVLGEDRCGKRDIGQTWTDILARLAGEGVGRV